MLENVEFMEIMTLNTQKGNFPSFKKHFPETFPDVLKKFKSRIRDQRTKVF